MLTITAINPTTASFTPRLPPTARAARSGQTNTTATPAMASVRECIPSVTASILALTSLNAIIDATLTTSCRYDCQLLYLVALGTARANEAASLIAAVYEHTST